MNGSWAASLFHLALNDYHEASYREIPEKRFIAHFFNTVFFAKGSFLPKKILFAAIYLIW